MHENSIDGYGTGYNWIAYDFSIFDGFQRNQTIESQINNGHIKNFESTIQIKQLN